MKGVYKLNIDCGRNGTLEGLFIAESQHVRKIIGTDLHFGEALGRHSAVIIKLEESQVKLITEDPKIVSVVEKYNLESGYNPFEYWRCGECGSIVDPDTGKCSDPEISREG